MVATTLSLWTSSPQPRSTTCSNEIDPLSIALLLFMFFVLHKIRRLCDIFIPFCLNAPETKTNAGGGFSRICLIHLFVYQSIIKSVKELKFSSTCSRRYSFVLN